MFSVQQPPPEVRQDASALADWIEQQVPCYEDSKPVEWSTISKILQILDESKTSKGTTVEALDELASRGIKFTRPYGYYAKPPLPNLSSYTRPQVNMRAPSRGRKQRIQDTFAHHDERLKAAILSGDVSEAQVVFQAILDVLWAWLDAESGSRKNRLSTEMIEWDEFHRAVTVAFERAQVSRNHIRQISRAEWQEMRSAPTPRTLKNIRIRISRRLVRVNSARRNARRRARR